MLNGIYDIFPIHPQISSTHSIDIVCDIYILDIVY